MLKRTIFSEEHEMFRDSVRAFFKQEVGPNIERWEHELMFERELWRNMARQGFLCPTMPEAYGGAGADLLYSVILLEEGAQYSNIGLSFSMHSEIVANYILHHGSEETKQKYLPKMASGEMVAALAMTEPSGGSDVKAIRTSAVKDGGDYLLNGSKIFITSGAQCDLAVVVARTDPTKGAKGISLLVVDRSMPGFTSGKPLKKVGMKVSDTTELYFDNVRIPAANLLGKENEGFIYSMQELPWERMQIAVSAVAAAEAALQWTIDYVRERKAFGQEVLQFQNTRFKLAELKTEIQIARVFVDRCLAALLEGQLDAADASMAKYWTSDLQCKVVDECVQLFGGYGYMWEYPIARAWADARAQRIYGGTNEIMKELISRSL
ncbi:MAG: acyl-CoA dehydrogenase family protein [Sterolibacterium sp.]|nr:acyl-CoA dehydrogenase family protein [Sterolibacterium sp.]